MHWGSCVNLLPPAALLAVAFSMSCGVPDEATTLSSQAETVAPSPELAPRASPPERLTIHERHLPDRVLSFAFRGLPQQGHLIARLGVFGCGFDVLGRGDATISDGVATVNISVPAQDQEQAWLLFFVDADADGQCTTEHVSAQKVSTSVSGREIDPAESLPTTFADCEDF
jgi:hypothetical protein